MRLVAARMPDINSTHRESSSGLEIAQKVVRRCQSVARPNHLRRVILLLRERVSSFGNLHRSRQLVSHLCMAPLPYECDVQEPRTIKGMTQRLRTVVTNSDLGCSQSSSGC